MIRKILNKDNIIDYKNNNVTYKGKKIIITIDREYGSGGRYIATLLANKLGIKYYDDSIISLSSNIDEKSFIEKVYEQESCVIVCKYADYILKGKRNVISVFLYNSLENKIKRAINYYGLKKKRVLKKINKVNKKRKINYKNYTNRNWKDLTNYDLIINVDEHGIERTIDMINNYVIENIR